jgi:hypothetical protein
MKKWLIGLLRAVISGAAHSAGAALGGMYLAPSMFNFGPQFHNMLKLAAISGVLGMLTGTFNYLAQSPLPKEE